MRPVISRMKHAEGQIKVKLKLFLCLTKHDAMKTFGEWRYSSTAFLTSALDADDYPLERDKSTPPLYSYFMLSVQRTQLDTELCKGYFRCVQRSTRVYPKVSGPTAWSENWKCH
jgi:hypothetical protein